MINWGAMKVSTLTDCLDFLECLGADATLREADSSDLEDSLARANILPALSKAIAAGDSEALAALLGRDSRVCCLIAPGKEEEEEETPEEEEEGEEEEEEEEDDHARVRDVAASGASPVR